jgi:acyl carrier protein
VSVKQVRSREDIEAWLAREIGQVIDIPESEVERHRNILELGVGSRTVVRLSGRLQKWLGIKLPPTILFEYPTVEALAEHLSGEGEGGTM